MNVRLLLFALLLLFINDANAQEVSTVLTKPGARFEGITWGGNGRIYVVDFASGEVFKMDVEGNIERIGPIFNGALGGAMDKDHNFYFSEYNTGNIIRIRPDDSHEVYCSGLKGPAGILIDDDNQVMYISNYGDSKIEGTTATTTPSLPQITIGPNPVAEWIHIEFTLPKRDQVAIQLLDAKGATVDTILPAQSHNGLVNLEYRRKRNLPSGLYIVNIKIGQENQSHRVVLE